MSLSAKSSNRVGSSYESSTCCYAVAEVIKQRHAVRLGPHAHCARAGDVVVVHLDVGLAVEDNADPLARELHAQRVEFSGKRIRVVLDGKPHIEMDDDHIAGAGAVGVWTKADSVTLFDDFGYGVTAR